MTQFSYDYAGEPNEVQEITFAGGKITGRLNLSFQFDKIEYSAFNGVQVRGGPAQPAFNLRLDYLGDENCADLSPLAHIKPRLVGAIEIWDETSIRITDCQFDDYQLRHILHFSNLSVLDFTNSSLSEFGLFLIKDLPQVTTLILNGTQTNDLGLSYLSGFKCRNLYFKRTMVTDAGLSVLRTMPNLKYISLSEEITGLGLRSLDGLQLTDLDLSCCTRLRNEDLTCLTRLAHLEGLHLPANVHDGGLKCLLGMRLKRLYLPPGSLSTEEGRQKLISGGTAEAVTYPVTSL